MAAPASVLSLPVLKHLPNFLSLLRLAAAPLTAWLILWGQESAAFLLFAAAGFTDWLDGYLARKLNQSTSFGAFLDPVADKLMVAIALVLMVGQQDSVWFTLPALVVVAREILVSALREWMADIGKRGSGPGEFNLPRDLAIGLDGRLYVVDGGNFRVVVFDRNGNEVGRLEGGAEWDSPEALALLRWFIDNRG